MLYNPQLETFICVVEAGSFSKAADRLFISPPAVIKQINSLESSINLPLFIRNHRGLTVTEAGKSLYNDAKDIIQLCNNAVTRAKDSVRSSDNVIKVGISPMTPPQIFVELWPNLNTDLRFQLVPFENTPENAKEILGNLGKTIDVVAGIFDESMLDLRNCSGIEISREPFCIAVSVNHRLADRASIDLCDLYGENIMLMKRGWSRYVDELRDTLISDYPQISIIDFDFYNIEVFNICENSSNVLLAIKNWENIHPLMKIIPVNWDYSIPFGLLYSKEPSDKVKELLKAVTNTMK